MKLWPLLIFAFSIHCVSLHAETNDVGSLVQPIINAFKNNNRNFISGIVDYPLMRRKPIPSINNSPELLKRFDDIFDHRLIKLLSNSNPVVDWGRVGSRGIMFMNGELWLNSNGLIIAVNYQSQTEALLKSQLLGKQKEALHHTIASFEEPALEWRTEKYRVRVDEVKRGLFRYAVWAVDSPTSSKPDLIINNGELTHEGSGGNHFYSFVNGKYKYICNVIMLGSASSPPGRLSIYHGDSLLISQDVIEVLK